jgi:hypothetical protein
MGALRGAARHDQGAYSGVVFKRKAGTAAPQGDVRIMGPPLGWPAGCDAGLTKMGLRP